MLETPLVVEGGILKGRLEIKVRKPKEKEGDVWVGRPKVRVVGFEGQSALVLVGRFPELTSTTST
jgi:hypothetical protein